MLDVRDARHLGGGVLQQACCRVRPIHDPRERRERALITQNFVCIHRKRLVSSGPTSGPSHGFRIADSLRRSEGCLRNRLPSGGLKRA